MLVYDQEIVIRRKKLSNCLNRYEKVRNWGINRANIDGSNSESLNHRARRRQDVGKTGVRAYKYTTTTLQQAESVSPRCAQEQKGKEREREEGREEAKGGGKRKPTDMAPTLLSQTRTPKSSLPLLLSHPSPAITQMPRPLPRKHPPAHLAPPAQQPKMHRQQMPYHAPPLHRRCVASLPLAAYNCLVVSPHIVR